MVIRVGTRGSKLALKQTEIFIEKLKSELKKSGENEPDFEIIKIKTKGDKILDSPLSKIPGKGFFVKEIEEELAQGKIDFAVHSLKDVPTEMPENLVISAFLKRDPPGDVILGMTKQEIALSSEKSKVKIGTSSLRREIQLKKMFGKNIEVIPIRGNLDTRIRKVERKECDAIVVAYCGVIRLGFEDKISDYLDPREFLYAPGQGIIAVEARKDNELAIHLSKLVDDKESRFLGTLEREIVRKIGGGCNSPFGIFSEIKKEPGGDKEVVLFLKFCAFERNISYESYFKLSDFDSSEISECVREICEKVEKDIRRTF
jgi:hydroxymethylbilane synthase